MEKGERPANGHKHAQTHDSGGAKSVEGGIRTLRVFFGAILTSGRVLSHLAFTSLTGRRVAVCEQDPRGIISPILLAMLVLERTDNDNSRRATCATILHRVRCSGGDSGDLTLLERVAGIVGLLESSSTQ